jgi:hypothetical protein
LILLATAGVRLEQKLLPGVARFARSPLANLLARLRRAERSPEGCGSLAPGGAKRHPGFESAMMIAPRPGCEDPLADHPGFHELRSSEVQISGSLRGGHTTEDCRAAVPIIPQTDIPVRER